MPSTDEGAFSLPGHRIKGELHRSMTSVVYLAEDVRLGRRVAVKALRPAYSRDEMFRRRFLREWRTTAGLSHPHVMPVYGVGESGGSLYAVMPYIHGGDLWALLESNGPLTLEHAVSVVAQTGEALDYLHAQGLVHRDVKPENILVDTRSGRRCYLSDFGIATGEASTRRPGTGLTGYFVGSLGYMAPEQITAQVVDRRSDVYALGCVLYACLTTMAPFQEHEPALGSHRRARHPSLAALRPDLPPQIDRVVAKAMAADPRARYSGCGELAEALRRIATP
ncbi:serine/threonine-protein kinase [Streptosporangium sp. NPDC000396]|uniref:serine/threonine-protein kinase n=1 Tax=Streptosporangium sp. NPDC000396 TaxID=3366185 RepID=UPI0036C8F2AA